MAAPVVPTYTVAGLVATTRSDSDLNRSQVYTDTQIAALISDAGSALQDVFTGANQHYNISTFDFTLVGGVGQNTVPLPVDFQQGHSVDVNPGTAQPYTLRYLPNWLDRNRLNNAMPFAIGGPGGGPREYYILGAAGAGGVLGVLPAMGAAGNYRLYYTPMWTPLAIPATLLVETAGIHVVPATTMGFTSGPGVFQLDTGPDTFLSSDVGDVLSILGATNPQNNGQFAITSFNTQRNVTVNNPSSVSETFPNTATVTLFRQSRVDNAGNWTLYGDTAFNNASIAVNVGDVLVVKGTQHNDGNYTITQAATGGVTITTTGVATTPENFDSAAITMQVQPAGTRPDLPTFMNPWVRYLKTQTCITIRNKRGQDVQSFMATLGIDQARIDAIVQERVEEPQQPPLTRNRGWWGGW